MADQVAAQFVALARHQDGRHQKRRDDDQQADAQRRLVGQAEVAQHGASQGAPTARTIVSTPSKSAGDPGSKPSRFRRSSRAVPSGSSRMRSSTLRIAAKSAAATDGRATKGGKPNSGERSTM